MCDDDGGGGMYWLGESNVVSCYYSSRRLQLQVRTFMKISNSIHAGADVSCSDKPPSSAISVDCVQAETSIWLILLRNGFDTRNVTCSA